MLPAGRELMVLLVVLLPRLEVLGMELMFWGWFDDVTIDEAFGGATSLSISELELPTLIDRYGSLFAVIFC